MCDQIYAIKSKQQHFDEECHIQTKHQERSAGEFYNIARSKKTFIFFPFNIEAGYS